MSLINTNLSLERLIARLSVARETRLIAVEFGADDGLRADFRCTPQDFAEAALELLNANAECEDLRKRTGCPTCDERRRRVLACLEILGAPLVERGHVH